MARELSSKMDKFFKFRKVDEQKLFHSTSVTIWNFWFEITLKRVIFAGSGGAWPNFPGKWDNSSYSSDLFPDVFFHFHWVTKSILIKNVQLEERSHLCHDVRSSVFAINGQISPGHVTSGDYYFYYNHLYIWIMGAYLKIPYAPTYTLP